MCIRDRVGVDNGSGAVTPSMETVSNGTYSPLSRPIFIYASNKAKSNKEVSDFVNFYLSINPTLRMSYDKIEKCMLRKAFEKDNLLPEEVLWRFKEAFSDGVTVDTRSWHQIIKEFVDTQITDEYFEQNKIVTFQKT